MLKDLYLLTLSPSYSSLFQVKYECFQQFILIIHVKMVHLFF